MHPSGTGMAATTGSRFRLSVRPVIIFAHLLVVAVTPLVLVWHLNFQKDIAFESRTKEKIVNLMHPLLMAIGFGLVAGEAIMTSRTVPAEKETFEIFQLILHGVALVAGIIGIYAVFKYHNELSIPNMNTLHSWIGMSTFGLFSLQFLLGLFSFMFPGANSGARSRMMTMVIFLMVIISAETGLVERFTIIGPSHDQKALIMKFTGLLILLSGVAVGLRTRSRMVKVYIGIVIFLSAKISAKTVPYAPLTLLRHREVGIMSFTGILILLFGVALCLEFMLPTP